MKGSKKQLNVSAVQSFLQEKRGLDRGLIRRVATMSYTYPVLRNKFQLIGMMRIAACYPQNRSQAVHLLLDALISKRIQGFDTKLIRPQVIAYHEREAKRRPHHLHILRCTLRF
ncbi:MAG: hypothetical protein WC663_00440 [Patescibacteria group bacterium]